MPVALQALRRWLGRRRAVEQREVVLVRRRIFVMPTRFGVLFAIVLMLLLVGSINYTLSLGYLLTFLLTALAVSAILHTYRNIAGLRISAGRTPAVFAGDVAHFQIRVDNPARAERCSVSLARDKRAASVIDVPAQSTVIATASVSAARRGVLRPGRLTVSTRFPLGLFRAWSYVHLDARCIVYPRPALPGAPLPPTQPHAAHGTGRAFGNDDFAGLRRYHPGDSPRRVAWKAAAREENLFTKQFVGEAETELWLRASDTPAALGWEEKLSRLTRWVLQAHAGGFSYGLDLPGHVVPIGYGLPHRDRCLEALALFDTKETVRPLPMSANKRP
jgi:uncharacterized protein (DUF58 family)